MNSKLLKIAMCLMLVGGIAGMQNGYSMDLRENNVQHSERQKLSRQMIQENQYLQKIFKGKNIKGNGFADYKDTYRFSYDLSKLSSLADPSETTLSNAMSTVRNAIDKLDFRSANKSLIAAKDVVLNANKAVLELRNELEHLMGVEDSYCNTLDDMDAQKAKIQENINYYTQQIQILEDQMAQIEEKSGYVDEQYGILKNTMSHAVDFITKYHSATEAARNKLMSLAKEVQTMQTDINDIKIDEDEMDTLNRTVMDLNQEMQNNLVNMNEQNKSFRKQGRPFQQKYQPSQDIIKEVKEELINTQINNNNEEIKIENKDVKNSAEGSNQGTTEVQASDQLGDDE